VFRHVVDSDVLRGLKGRGAGVRQADDPKLVWSGGLIVAARGPESPGNDSFRQEAGDRGAVPPYAVPGGL
jgi:hypothetical protein